MVKAFNQLMMADRRRLRSQSLLSHILHIVGMHLNGEDNRRNALRDIAYELDEKFRAEGVEIITDATRSEAGLPPRGPDGWTLEELQILERRRIEAMYSTVPPVIIVKDGK